jgi:hypothetical protein
MSDEKPRPQRMVANHPVTADGRVYPPLSAASLHATTAWRNLAVTLAPGGPVKTLPLGGNYPATVPEKTLGMEYKMSAGQEAGGQKKIDSIVDSVIDDVSERCVLTQGDAYDALLKALLERKREYYDAIERQAEEQFEE